MNYTIKTYQEGFIEDQFKIGSAIYDPWPMGGQTRPDQLRAAYQGENFDPTTRFYAFNGDEMVGFLTSSFKEEREGKKVYFFEPPYVKPEHAPEAETQLLDHALEQLKSKGADILLTRAGEYWGKSLHYAQMYGFEHKQDIVRGSKIDLSAADPSSFGDSTRLVDFDPEEHFEEVLKLVAKRFNADPENLRPRLESWKKLSVSDTITSPWDHILTILAHKVIVDNGEVIARLVAMNHSNFGQDSINLSQLVTKEGHEDVLGDALACVVKTGIEHGKSHVIVHSGLWGVVPTDEPFEKYGISLDMKLAYFEKELN